jgi:hypothetical protein
MAQKKEASGKKDIKVQDLAPKKDAKGGRAVMANRGGAASGHGAAANGRGAAANRAGSSAN